MRALAFIALAAATIGTAPAALADTVEALRVLQRGSIIGPGDVTLTYGEAKRNEARSMQDVIGMEVRATVRPGRAIRKTDLRAPILVEARANARWSLEFVHDQFGCSRRFRILNVVDDVTRECLGAIPDTSIPITEPRCHRMRSCLGVLIIGSSGTTSRRVSLCKTVSLRVSTDACAMSC